jgi:hypothetical protein
MLPWLSCWRRVSALLICRSNDIASECVVAICTASIPSGSSRGCTAAIAASRELVSNACSAAVIFVETVFIIALSWTRVKSSDLVPNVSPSRISHPRVSL